MNKKKPKLTDGLLPLKKVEGRMPYFLDLMWDIKVAEDIDREGQRDNPTLQRALAEHGYDVKAWLAHK